jgi:hypothetical protein
VFGDCNVVEMYKTYITIYSDFISIGASRDATVIKCVEDKVKVSKFKFDEV